MANNDNPYVLPGDDQYSARLFGSPHQLSHLCDMRIDSMGDDKSTPGEVGNFYLNHVLKDAQLAYFTVGKAVFTGGMNSLKDVIATTNAYMQAWNNYKTYGIGTHLVDEGSVDSTTDYDLAQYAKDDHTVTTVNTSQDTANTTQYSKPPEWLVNFFTTWGVQSNTESESVSDIKDQLDAVEIDEKTKDKFATNLAYANDYYSMLNEKGIDTTTGGYADNVYNYVNYVQNLNELYKTVFDEDDGSTFEVSDFQDKNKGLEYFNARVELINEALNNLEQEQPESLLPTKEEPTETVDTDSTSKTTTTVSTGTDIFDQSEDGLYKYVEFPDGMSTISSSLGLGLAMLKTSLCVEQPMYSFDSDWMSYINNVKTMIHTAAMMLGLQHAPILIGAGKYMKAGLGVKLDNSENDVWANYRYMDTTDGAILNKDSLDGYTNQYVVFMVEPADSIQEQYTNNYTTSQINSLMQTGSTIGNEIAFITGSTTSTVDDTIVKLVDNAVDIAESALANLSSGVGKFTAAVAGSMAKSYTGKHYIYPEVFSNYQTDGSTQTININLVASSGDPYTQFIDILVPTFFILGMAIPNQSKNNAAAYDYPPLVQCNIPGKWGARLGAIQSVTFTKSGQCKNGYPTNVKVSIQIKNLIPSLTTSSITDPNSFLNNNPMFDYIARRCGVDQCRPNGSIRLATKIMLAQNVVQNFGSTLRDAILSDVSSSINHLTKYSMF